MELYQSEEVATKLDEVSEGEDLPAWSDNDAYPIELGASNEENESEDASSEEESTEEESTEKSAE